MRIIGKLINVFNKIDVNDMNLIPFKIREVLHMVVNNNRMQTIYHTEGMNKHGLYLTLDDMAFYVVEKNMGRLSMDEARALVNKFYTRLNNMSI